MGLVVIVFWCGFSFGFFLVGFLVGFFGWDFFCGTIFLWVFFFGGAF